MSIDGGVIIIGLTVLLVNIALYAWYACEHVSESIEDTVDEYSAEQERFLKHCTEEGARVYTAEEINEFAERLKK